jgi:very-short-patch-repair endonuclease
LEIKVNDIPDWAALELKALYAEHDRIWKTARPLAKSIYTRMGWKPTPQQVYNVLNDIKPEDIITECGKEKRFDSFWGGYRFCGRTCECSRKQAAIKGALTNTERYGVSSALARPDIRDKRDQTMLDRYGVKHSGSSPELLAKAQSTMLERYGVDNSGKMAQNIERMQSENNPNKSEVNKAKTRATLKERYGVESVFHSPEVMAKTRNTMLERYGVEKAAQNPELFAKIKATNLERYGVEFLQQSEEMRDRSRATMQERYGVDNSSQVPEVIEKRKQTNLDRYGVESCLRIPEVAANIKRKANKTNLKRYGNSHISHRHLTPEAVEILTNKEIFTEYIEHKAIATVANELGVNTTTIYKYCGEYGIANHRSSYEREILSHIQYVDDIVTNYRRLQMLNNHGKKITFELDFYIPSRNLAIEFNGIYWHSDIFKDRYYHQRKYLACKEQGIRLLMINEDEWLRNSDVIKSKISNVLGNSERGTPARKLSLQSISPTGANTFIARHHIQGATGSIINAVAAYDGDELVGVMAFNKQRGTGDIELIRFCSSGKTHAGMFSRMFKWAIREWNYDKVLSFADLRYSEGAVYETNGFELVNEIPPDYRYVLGNETFHKSAFTKKNIEKKFSLDMSVLTERQAMEELGIPRIYDCGKLKYCWNKTK